MTEPRRDEVERIIRDGFADDTIAQGVEIERVTPAQVAVAMLEAWDDICSDTGCHPLDIERRGKNLMFAPGHWARFTAMHLNAALEAASSLNPEAPVAWMYEYLKGYDGDIPFWGQPQLGLADPRPTLGDDVRNVTPLYAHPAPLPKDGAVKTPRPLVDELTGALRFIMAFYEPGQTYLDTNAWKVAEAGGRNALAKGEAFLTAQAAIAERESLSPNAGEIEAGGEVERYCGGLEAPPPNLARAARETVAAQRIFEIFCGGKVDWEKHSTDDAEDNIFASADWQYALRLARAALESRQ